MRTFHSFLSYRFPEIAEAIDLDLFQSLNDFGIQVISRSVLRDLQEVGAVQQWILDLAVAGHRFSHMVDYSDLYTNV